MKKAAQATATTGERTRVETTVAMLLAASWKPLMKSNGVPRTICSESTTPRMAPVFTLLLPTLIWRAPGVDRNDAALVHGVPPVVPPSSPVRAAPSIEMDSVLPRRSAATKCKPVSKLICACANVRKLDAYGW